MGVMGV